MIPMRGAGRDQQMREAAERPEFDFRTCPDCGGFGVRDNGRNCRPCGGSGSGGLRGSGVIGSGEIIIETASWRVVSPKEYRRIMAGRGR